MKQTIGLLLVTLGAILRYAIESKWDDVNVPTIGTILMIVGAIAFLTDVALEVAKRRAAKPMPVTPPPAPAMTHPTAAPLQPQQPPPQQWPQSPQSPPPPSPQHK